MALTIRRLGYALGAQITGLDLARHVDDPTIARIRQAWLDHGVLCFPEQNLGPEQLVAFSQRFGTIDDNRQNLHMRHPDCPPVLVIVSKSTTIAGKRFRGDAADKWHTDRSHTNRPTSGSFLLAKELPQVGGDTMFANMYMAYDTLSPTMRQLLEGLSAVHDVANSPTFAGDSPEVQAQRRRLNPPVVHPVVRLHPETGRKALYVGDRIREFVGMTPEETQPLLSFVNRHAIRYEFLYRHRWSVNDLVMWDNRCTMHFAVQDYDHTQLRRMIRCALFADKSGSFYTEATAAPRE
jgi:taurine dioxygenase